MRAVELVHKRGNLLLEVLLAEVPVVEARVGVPKLTGGLDSLAGPERYNRILIKYIRNLYKIENKIRI